MCLFLFFQNICKVFQFWCAFNFTFLGKLCWIYSRSNSSGLTLISSLSCFVAACNVFITLKKWKRFLELCYLLSYLSAPCIVYRCWEQSAIICEYCILKSCTENWASYLKTCICMLVFLIMLLLLRLPSISGYRHAC